MAVSIILSKGVSAGILISLGDSSTINVGSTVVGGTTIDDSLEDVSFTHEIDDIFIYNVYIKENIKNIFY
jgi:hypothetical protein